MKTFTIAAATLLAIGRAQVVDLKALANSLPAPVIETAPFGAEDNDLLTARYLRFAKRAACGPKTTGRGPEPAEKSALGFVNDADFTNTASNASTPTGYAKTFTNLNASISSTGYKTMKTLATYDPSLCAAECTKMDGCNAFNIYYERNGLNATGKGCPMPLPTNIIKCSFWSTPVFKKDAINHGQWMAGDNSTNSFQVVIAASNGYVNQRFAPIDGYTDPEGPWKATLNAPLDCNGVDTYIRSATFPIDQDFKPEACARACADQAAYERRHPSPGGARTCQFFNTYLLNKNGTSTGQVCAMYTATWNPTYATNSGQGDYTIAFSLTYSNTSVPNLASTCQKAP